MNYSLQKNNWCLVSVHHMMTSILKIKFWLSTSEHPCFLKRKRMKVIKRKPIAVTVLETVDPSRWKRCSLSNLHLLITRYGKYLLLSAALWAPMSMPSWELSSTPTWNHSLCCTTLTSSLWSFLLLTC